MGMIHLNKDFSSFSSSFDEHAGKISPK